VAEDVCLDVFKSPPLVLIHKKREAKVFSSGGNLLEMQDRFYVGHGIVMAVWAEKNGGFLEVNILARPLQVGSEAIKDRVGFRGGGLGKKT
jgi:hypothetical protein